MYTPRKLAAVIAFVLLLVAAAVIAETKSGLNVSLDSATAWRTEEERRTIDVYKKLNEAVVFITTVTLTVDPFDLFPEVRQQQGSGSGIIVDAARAIVVTNLHVIQNAAKIEIMTADGHPHQARLLGYDREYDLAVLQIKNPRGKLVAAPYGDSSKLEVGQRVLAIGNPFGLYRTLTSGIISSLDRTVKGPGGNIMKGLIQTDAAINPGNSGGPLLDSDGRLIGINTAILSQSGDSAGIGFAVPINRVAQVLPELVATGKVLRPQLGWVLVDTTQGPMVRRVMNGGPAEKAGVQPIERPVESAFLRGYVRDFERADLIFKVNGKRVHSREQVEELIASSDRGQPISFVFRRGGKHGAEWKAVIDPVLQ